MRFWLDRGVDGFRVDAVQNLVKDEHLRDNPPNPHWLHGADPYDQLLRVYSSDRPEVHAKIAAMRRLMDAYGGDRVLIGEIYNSIERLMPYYGAEGGECSFPYNFHLIRTPWDARAIDALVRRYERLLPPGAWPDWVLGNHDRHRAASRVGPAQARVAAVLLLTLRGTPTLYYGDEIGMTDVPIAPGAERDPWGINLPGMGLGRDAERTPMQWAPEPGAGFTTGSPWLPISDDWRTVNVARQRDDPASLLSLYRRLIDLRRAEPALHAGAYLPVDAEGPVLAYVRQAEDGSRFLVALNLSAQPARLDGLRATDPDGGTVVLSTHAGRKGERVEHGVELRGDEAVVVRLRAWNVPHASGAKG
jgi:alpha-glucosidase